MSFTRIQEPTSPNAAYTRLLYTYSGSIYTDQPQFQYVCDVYVSGSSEIVKRMTQPINPAGTATFDVARIIQGELEVDYNWKINTPTPLLSGDNKGRKVFFIRGGEQFATSISSSVTVYADQDSNTLVAFQGVIEPNAGTYDWVSFPPAPIVLSNMPTTMSMQPDDYGTITYTTNITTYISQSFYSASDTTGTYDLVDEKNYTIPAATPYIFTEIPISSSNQNWNYVDVSITGSYLPAIEYRYEASDETHKEKTRFAFINKLGAWDYYNNYNPVRQRIDISRQQYTAPRVDYSSRLSTYDISRRGKTVNNSSTDDQFTVDTDYLDQANATWLEELIESPEVYIQRNGEFIPVLITDTSYTADTNPSRQKLFKYTINFKPSNQPFGTWIPEYVQCPKQLQPAVFDPTLDGEITPYFWYDFGDRDTMNGTGTPYVYSSISSKGTNTGSLARGSTSELKYSSSNWTDVIQTGSYSIFNSTAATDGKNSTLARKWGTGDYSADSIFNTGSTFTAIHFTQPVYSRTNTNTIQELISFKAEILTESASLSAMAEEITFLGAGINGTIDTSPATGNRLDFISTDTTNFTSMSYFEYEAPNVPGTTSARDYTGYSYNGTAGGWQSSYQVYNSGSSNTLKVGREPISSSQNFVTSSAIFQDSEVTSNTAEGLTIGSRAFLYTNASPGVPNTWTQEPLEFNISHFIMYDSVLSNDQIQRVIDNYSSSYNPVAFNTFEN
jgi:hypothetical protein